MKKYLLILTLLTISSCALFKKSEFSFSSSLSQTKDSEYISQLSSLTDVYLKTSGVNKIRLTKKSKKYLNSLYIKILSNNKLLLKEFYEPKFYVINSSLPFYFSLPKAQFFFSSGLILKYVKNEEMFFASFASEVVKSQRNIYPKNLIIPKGFITSADILGLVRLPVEVKSEVNKWTYHVIKRSGHDPYAYLIWLQSLNKNTLDFSILYGSTQDITKEEQLFKSFISKIKSEEFEFSERRKNSSQNFYSFLREVKRGAR
ncbi:hypothetical protein [Halobacteriovorax sp. HLS]|uniref:hypothetical protein n=1 Tax=Halobacteriovorax sp. HLS TaxID=2234000 RepID=UPI000FD7EBD1|nr:hypothetical protein [Halobacteriovorax sp. HLS]